MMRPTSVPTSGTWAPPDPDAALPGPLGAGLGPIRPAGLADVLRSEWIKLRSVRSTTRSLLIAVVLTVGIGALISHGFASRYRTMSLSDRLTFDPTAVSLSSLGLGQLAIGVLGVLVVTSEYSTGMIRTSLLAVPRRRRLLLAKSVVFTAVALLVGEIIGFVTFLVGQQLLQDGAPHATLGQPSVLRAVIGAGLYLALIGLLGIALGAILRHTAGAITVLVALTFVLPGVANALPTSWRRPVEKYWPTQAGSQIFSVRRGDHALTAWWGVGELALFTAIALAVAAWLIQRRDA